jgi:hypothetical protein
VAETLLPLPVAAPDTTGIDGAVGLTDTPPISMDNGAAVVATGATGDTGAIGEISISLA